MQIPVSFIEMLFSATDMALNNFQCISMEYHSHNCFLELCADTPFWKILGNEMTINFLVEGLFCVDDAGNPCFYVESKQQIKVSSVVIIFSRNFSPCWFFNIVAVVETKHDSTFKMAT